MQISSFGNICLFKERLVLKIKILNDIAVDSHLVKDKLLHNDNEVAKDLPSQHSPEKNSVSCSCYEKPLIIAVKIN